MLNFAAALFTKKEMDEAEARTKAGASGHFADPHAVAQDGGEPEDGVKGAMATQLTTQEINAGLDSLESRTAKLRILASEPAFGAQTPVFGVYAARNCSEDPTYPQWEVFNIKSQASVGAKWDNLNGAVEYMQMLAARDQQKAKSGIHTSLVAGLTRFSTVPTS